MDSFKDTIEFSIYRDVWNFHKKFYTPYDREDYWQAVIEESSQISKKYNNEFATALILDVLSELERKAKEMKRHGAHENV